MLPAEYPSQKPLNSIPSAPQWVFLGIGPTFRCAAFDLRECMRNPFQAVLRAGELIEKCHRSRTMIRNGTGVPLVGQHRRTHLRCIKVKWSGRNERARAKRAASDQWACVAGGSFRSSAHGTVSGGRSIDGAERTPACQIDEPDE